MTRYRLILQYDGTEYCGWQRQKNGVSVQETVEKALFSAFGVTATVTGSGRTDAGVHAAAQVAHFDAELSLPPQKIREAVNVFLPRDIRVLRSEVAAEGFHARFSAKKKTYVYRAYTAPSELPLLSRYAAREVGKFDLSAMQRAAETLTGTHDFAAFSSTGSAVKDTVRTVRFCEVRAEERGEATEYRITVTGNGFLYNMVRIVAGTLFAVGCGKLPEDVFLRAFIEKDRKTLGKTAKACGLLLLSVEYDEM